MRRTAVLKAEFFNRPILEVAAELLGRNLCRSFQDNCLRLPITEVEAYDGWEDRASHAHRGRTARNAVMFGPAGYWYVYLCYGIHWMLNIVTGEVGYPAAILIRGVGQCSGPGRLTKALKIDRNFDRLLATPESALWLERGNLEVDPGKIVRTPRIGVAYAGEVWSRKRYRFVWKR